MVHAERRGIPATVLPVSVLGLAVPVLATPALATPALATPVLPIPVLAIPVLAIIVLAAPTPASAWCQMTTRSERPPEDACLLAEPPDSFPLAWQQRCTSISLSRVGSSISMPEDQVRTILRRSIDTWEQVECPGGGSTGLHVELLPQLNECEEAVHFTGSGNVHSVVFVGQGWEEERMHARDAYAVTLVWHDPRSGAIWDVDMEVNEELAGLAVPSVYGDCADADTCPSGVVDLQNVLTHEMGHYFGLAHTPHDILATMYAMAESNETLKRTLQPDDIAGLCAIYPPGSLPETCDVTPRGGLDLACERSGCDCGIAGAGRDRSQSSLAMLALIGLAITLRRATSRARPGTSCP